METHIAVAAILLLWASALVGSLIGSRWRGTAVATTRGVAGLSAGLAAAAAWSSTNQPDPGAWLRVDRLGAGIAVFVTAMVVVVGTFASRSLAADRLAHRFFAAANLLAGSTVLLALAGRVWLIALGWLAVSASTVALIAYDGRPQARAAARRAAKAFAVGDLAMVMAAGVALSIHGDGDLATTAEAVGSSGGWAGFAIAALVTIAALARSAQLPFSSWLAATVAAPTPVSAMLHAGVVNGSALLLIRWQPALGATAVVIAATVLISIGGILIGMAVGRTRPDVKSGLAWTTVAQMAFMTVQCALGLVGPAIVHLMAHGLFKSSLFLGAASGLDGPGHHRHPAPLRLRPSLILATGASTAAIVAAGLSIVRPHFLDHPAASLPVAFAAATVAYGLVQWWTRPPALQSRRAWAAAIPMAFVGFTALSALSAAVDGWFHADDGVSAPAGAGWWSALTILAVGLVALGSGPISRWRPLAAQRMWMLVAAATRPAPKLWFRNTASPASPGSPVSPTGPGTAAESLASSADAARRHRIRSTITRAAADLAPTWPLERFVATNPLLAYEHLPIERAAEQAAIGRGVRAEYDELTYRRLYAQGRISTSDLRVAARQALELDPGAPGASDDVASTELGELLHDLLHAPAQHLPEQRPVLLSEWHDRAVGTDRASTVDELSSWWCAAYLSDHPASPLPQRAAGLYPAWRSLVTVDPRPHRALGPGFAAVVASLPGRADDAVLRLLVELGVDRPEHEAYLSRHLMRHPGWTSALVRRGGNDGEDLVGYVAIRLACEAAMFTSSVDRRRARTAAEDHSNSDAGDSDADVGPTDRLAIWREAFERRYRDELLASISPVTHSPHAADRSATERPSTQLVCCIDPRSEGLRRHLEALGPHETIGFAGFFGMAVAIADLGTTDAVPSCPVIVEPEATLVETVTAAPAHRRERLDTLHSLHDVFATAKRSTAAPFSMAETWGWISGASTASRTLAPQATTTATRAIRRALVPEPTTSMVPAPERWWSFDEQLDVAAGILRTTGLHDRPARLVVLCGHTSRHINNLHRSALDCGACGGRGGGHNARAAANLLNDPDLRAGLQYRGISVPPDTWFVAAEHDTTSDRVSMLDRHLVPSSHRPDLDKFEVDLARAGERLAAERGAQLPSTVGHSVGARVSAVRGRGSDWAQVIPEWGLVANAALIIGPRSLTANVDLQRRVFLHSYDPADDQGGDILANILAGPLQVAHWISSQYRLSTIDPDGLGAGTKVTHNLVGGVGVIDGADGDLRLGLPSESISMAGTVHHEAMRLLVVIDADADAVEHALRAVPAVATLADNGWIRLVARHQCGESGRSGWMLRGRTSAWEPWPAPDCIDRSTPRSDLVGSAR